MAEPLEHTPDSGAQPAPLSDAALSVLEQQGDFLAILVRLHDRELDRDVIAGLREVALPGWAEAVFDVPEVTEAATALDAALPQSPDAAKLDDLAAVYADLFLTHGYRVSPSASVWLTEDHLERQLPMFDVREWYEHYDISVPDWRVRADDHLVHELQFLTFLLGHGNTVAAQDAARFLDMHVLPWVPEFCRQAEARLEDPLYKAIMALTGATLDALRTELEEMTGIVRDVQQAAPPTAHRTPEDEEAAYIPGLAESW